DRGGSRHRFRRRQVVDQRRQEERLSRVLLDLLRVVLVDGLVRIASGLGVRQIPLAHLLAVGGGSAALGTRDREKNEKERQGAGNSSSTGHTEEIVMHGDSRFAIRWFVGSLVRWFVRSGNWRLATGNCH